MIVGGATACTARTAGTGPASAGHRDRPHTAARAGWRLFDGMRKKRGRHLQRPGGKSAGSSWHASCQNWRMTDRRGGDLTAILSEELAACRNRGIERLDVRSHNQQPVQAPELDRLAAAYAVATRSRAHGRIPQLKYLLREAIAAFGEESEMDARLVSALFFGDSLHRVTKSAGELLDIAQSQFGYDSSARFREARHAAFDNFAEFLLRFVADTGPVVLEADEATTDAVPEEAEPALLSADLVDSAPAPEVQQQIASTGYIEDGDHFVTLLSQAENITIVGYTNESLASMLRLALTRKREAELRPDSCWSSVRVVFLSDDLLDRVNDERGYPDPGEARLLRRRLAVYGRRSVRILLRSLPGRASWAIYDSSFFPPLVGTLFEMPDGHRIVHLVIRRRQRSGSNHLYLELDDTRGHYFTRVFDEIVASGTNDNKLIPAGRVVEGERFRTTSTRYRHHVLVDGSRVRDWLPMVLVITWQMRDGRAEPLFQLRTQRNSIRELDRFTHLAGHITQDKPIASGLEFGLEDDLPMTAAAQRVQMETGESDPGDLRPLVRGQYFHPDKERLCFFVYTCRLPDGLQLWPEAEMSVLSVPELLSIRKNQVLRKALALCQLPRRHQARGAAFEIVALNLVLHDYPDIAERLTEAEAARAADLDAIAAELGDLEERTRKIWPAYEGDVVVVGLSGFQFREFFRTLLPFYGSVGVPGAAEQFSLVRDDGAKRAAADRLSVLYDDERVMESIPTEL